MTREDSQLKFRVPAELRDRLEMAAGKNNRSLNAEITDRLQKSFSISDRERAIAENTSALRRLSQGFQEVFSVLASEEGRDEKFDALAYRRGQEDAMELPVEQLVNPYLELGETASLRTAWQQGVDDILNAKAQRKTRMD